MNIKTIEWKDNAIRIIDQTKLPNEFAVTDIRDLKTLWNAIKELKVRGAPALGAAAALGVYLGIKDSKTDNLTGFLQELDKVCKYIGSSRPTAVNLFWGMERIRKIVFQNGNKPVKVIKQTIFREAQKIIEEDRITCRKIGSFGSELIKDGDTILTVCNAGILATVDYGTALGVIYSAKEQGKRIKVFACETRPLLQGARLTTWELYKNGIDVTLICDNMAASLMAKAKINLVIAGADRIAANADTANKIGTYSLAVLSNYHKIPFYIAAPASTFDLNIESGKGIPIEERDAREVSELFFKTAITLKGVRIFNPAFDVTPADLITAIITDKGIIKPPYGESIKRIMSSRADGYSVKC